MIKSIITKKFEEIQKDLLTLISGGFITKTINELMNLKNIEKRESAIWGLFYFTGYLTTKDVRFNSRREYVCDFIIPNTEVNTFFKKTIKHQIGEQKYHSFIQSLANNKDLEKFTKYSSHYLDTIYFSFQEINV